MLFRSEGRVDGVLIRTPRGTGGFGYDPAFVPDGQPRGQSRTMAELSDEEKDRLSHRGKAFRALTDLLAG